MSEIDVTSPVETLTFLVSIDEDTGTESQEKGIFRSSQGEPTLRQIPLTVLQENLKETMDRLRKLFDIDSSYDSRFPLKQVEISFEITAGGKIALLGTSAEVTGSGAIKLTFGK